MKDLKAIKNKPICSSKLATYNMALSTVDNMADDIDTIEQATPEISEKMLIGIGSRYRRTS
jgi:hypothetical protein